MKRIEQQTLKFIDEQKLIKPSEKILVALSGGPDSVFLLRLLAKFKNRFKIELGAVHVNHQLRKHSADEDERFCEELCASLKIPLFIVSKNVKQYSVKNKLSIEEAARVVRYAVFNKIVELNSFDKIATAHNLSDNTETVLLNLVKGTGLKGIAGIPVSRDNIIRPLISVSKADIIEYLDNERIPFRIDESNNENVYERNFLRNEVIPLIKSRLNPAVENNIFRSAAIFRQYTEAFNFEVEKYTSEVVRFEEGRLYIKIIAIKNPYLVNDVISGALKRYFDYNCNYDDIKKITGLASKKNGKQIELKENLSAFKEAGLVFISRNEKKIDFEEKTISVGEKICINDKEDMYISLIDKKNVVFTNNKNEEFISGDKLGAEFVIRKWKAGDKFRPLGLNGQKKVSDFLNETKITGKKKENQLLLTQNSKIVWVIGLRTDEKYKICETTKKALALCLKKTF